MPWLLYRVVRDRPGLLHDLTAVVNDNGLDTTSGIGNTRAIMLGISGDPTPIIQRLTTEGVELINVINESVIPIAFSRRQFISALKSTLQQVGIQNLNSTLYRIGYEYARALITEIPLGGDSMNTLRTLLYTATAIIGLSSGVLRLGMVRLGLSLRIHLTRSSTWPSPRAIYMG